MNWVRWSVFLLAVFFIVGMSAIVYGSWRWERDTQLIASRLEVARISPANLSSSTARYDARELEGLPAPVQRYFRKALKDGQPIIEAASLEQVGTFNMSETAEKWKPFTAKQRVVTQRPGFDWDARIKMFPGVPMHIHDAYVAGHGMLQGALWGLIPLVNMPDSAQLQRGEFMRYFMEAIWYPTALLPSQGVRWEAVDDRSARATLGDGGVSVTLTFGFLDDSLIGSARAESRGRLVSGVASGAPWQGRFWNYALRGGMQVPLDGEVAWVMPDGMKPYYRGKLTSLVFEFATPR
jgi:hypothetical protein